MISSKMSKHLTAVSTFLIVGFLFGCSISPNSRPENEKWVELTTLVDGFIEIVISVPQPVDNRWTTRTHFIKSEPGKFTSAFIASYDPGWGRMAGVPMVRIAESAIRIDTNGVNNRPINFEDIMQTVYLPLDENHGEYEVIGIEAVGEEDWYRLNFKSKYSSYSVLYFKPVSDDYALLLTLNVYGENSENSKLFQQRLEDLQKAMASVKVNIADFAKKSE